MTETAPATGADTLNAEEDTQVATGLAANLEAVFRKIEQERMLDVPILNPLLHVACIGMRRSGACWLSVLVTPWFINVMLLPGSEAEAGAWNRMAPGAKVKREFPSGLFEFICGAEEGIGPYQTCSLFSPVLEFENQEAAIAAAEAALGAIFDATLHPGYKETEASAEPSQGEKEAAKLSRRDLFTGSLKDRDRARE